MAVRAHCLFTPFDASSGAALTGATVNVFQPGTVTPVTGTLFDKNGNSLTNPLTSDATTGLVDFYMNVAQEVDLQVAKTGYTTRTYSNVPVLDDASFDLSALMTTTGDIVYASSANTPARLALGANGTFLTVHSGLPAWQNTIDAGGLTITAGGLTVTAGNVGIGTPASASYGLQVTGGSLAAVLVSGSLIATGGSTIGANNPAPASGLLLGGAPPVVNASQVGLGFSFGSGNGGAATLPVLKGTGFGPTAAVGWWQFNAGGSTYYLPYFQ